jgi:hypothetical protein
MTSKKFDLNAFADQFEIVIDGIGAVEGEKSRGESVSVEAKRGKCSANYGQPCNNEGNNPCDERGIHVTHCDESGVYYCDKVNNQGCHGAGRISITPR